MGQILKKEFGLSKQSRIGVLTLLFLLAVLSIFVFERIKTHISGVVLENGRENIIKISELNARAIYKDMSNKQSLMLSFAASLSDGRKYDGDLLLGKMSLYAENYDFYSMGILTKDGMLHTMTDLDLDVSDRWPYEEALEGKPIISKSVPSADGSGVKINVLTAPVFYDGKLEYVVVGAYGSDSLAETLGTDVYGEDGAGVLIDDQGQVVVYPESGVNDTYLEILEYIDTNAAITPESVKKGEAIFKYKDERYFVLIAPVGMNDWYLASCAREREVFSGTQIILRSVLHGMTFLWVQIFVALGIALGINMRYQKKMQTVVFEDRLIRAKNFEYLRIYYPHIPKEERDKMVFAVLDVDKFKEFNFIYGSKNGDRLLKYIYRAFSETLLDDRIFRNTADQFTALIRFEEEDEIKDKMKLLYDRFARDVEKKLIQPFELSVGMCMMRNYDTLQAVFSDAMIAKNTIKGNHVRKYAFYDEQMSRQRRDDMEMESAFQDAVRNREFKIFYQPKYDMRTGRIVGAEALARWIRPDGTKIFPGKFIPCFEASGQIVALDEIILENVCRQMKEMERKGVEVKRVSINLSRVHLKYPGIIDKLEDIIRTTDFDPSRLSFEITESAMYEDNIPLNRIVERLHNVGCRVEMDDYGTGASGLGSMANVAFDAIKLDKSFIDRIGDPKMNAVIRSTIRLASELGMKILAEGVEEAEQADKLKEWGCYYAQGFYYARPVPAKEYRAMLEAQSRENHSEETADE